MRRARDIWPWFLLVPYFAVSGLNVRPWLGEERRSANRTNAQLSLAFLFACLGFPLLDALGITGGWFGKAHPYWLSLLLILPAWVAVSLWLNSAREAEYHKAYCAMAPALKASFGIATAIVAAICLWISLRN